MIQLSLFKEPKKINPYSKKYMTLFREESRTYWSKEDGSQVSAMQVKERLVFDDILGKKYYLEIGDYIVDNDDERYGLSKEIFEIMFTTISQAQEVV